MINFHIFYKRTYYEKVLVPNITKRFELDELVTYLTNGNKRFVQIYKLDLLNTTNLEDILIAKFRVINVKKISTIKTESIPIKFIYSSIYFIIDEMRNTIEQQYLKEIATEKMLMKNYDDTIKSVKSDNNKVNDVVQKVNNEGVKLQEEVQAVKQLRMQL